MAAELEVTDLFVKQFTALGEAACNVLEEKIRRTLEDPFSNKRLAIRGRHIFRIRFSDRRADKRAIYEINEGRVTFHCILDCKDGYGNLHKHLTKHS